MLFPEVDRVIYKKNPLKNVICQFRFPPILKIDAEPPMLFQEKIKNEFPEFRELSEVNFVFPNDVELQIPQEALRQLSLTSNIKNYEFSSEDKIYKVNLTRNALTLTSSKYERWEEYLKKILMPMEALLDIYSPTYFSRIGLRYINIIRRSVLGLDETDWNDLIKPYLLGVMSSTNVGSKVIDFESLYNIPLDGYGMVRLVAKLIKTDEGEKAFVIDNDFFENEKFNYEKGLEKLNFFNTSSSRLFQWAITKRLHCAMEPEKI